MRSRQLCFGGDADRLTQGTALGLLRTVNRLRFLSAVGPAFQWESDGGLLASTPVFLSDGIVNDLAPC
ncbi:hypothetical protein AC20117_21100 [Arthrobacter crystallopoietes]|nr:hypothetical protein AC20117_21100 [Arthrobacter crystallopoietes]